MQLVGKRQGFKSSTSLGVGAMCSGWSISIAGALTLNPEAKP